MPPAVACSQTVSLGKATIAPAADLQKKIIFLYSNISGMQTMEVQIPDTAITSWVANGFAMSYDYGMGISSQAILKAFQPFFVQMTLPYSVIRGEEIPITVTVFNYLSSCVPVSLKHFIFTEFTL